MSKLPSKQAKSKYSNNNISASAKIIDSKDVRVMTYGIYCKVSVSSVCPFKLGDYKLRGI